MSSDLELLHPESSHLPVPEKVTVDKQVQAVPLQLG